jgi:hypothetical protein
MKRTVLVAAVMFALIVVPVAAGAARHCGSFKYGTDGFSPGPSGITAEHVSCWFARATALVGTPPGWRCRTGVGLLFVCKPTHGQARVTFYGE